MKCRTTYSSKKKMKLVRSIREGGNIEAIGEESGVPARNLFRWAGEDVNWRENGNNGPYIFSKRRGPDPTLPKEAEKTSGMHHQDQELHQKQYHDQNHKNEHKHEEEQGMESELVLVQQQSEVASSDTVLFEASF
ncbi:hypothetical protein PInf_020329 [Phytophthora infestans]|nr:hypothetical protein PInf_020329 [Phytophthora infestans]